MKIAFHLLILTLGISVFAQDTVKVEYFESGKIMSVHINFDSLGRDGEVRGYFESGKLRLFQSRQNINMKGEWIEYFENGSIERYSAWDNYAPMGRAYQHYKNGKLEYEKFYLDSFKSGTWKFYDSTGTLKEEYVFEERKTSHNSKEDFALVRCYADNTLAYTVELVAGVRKNLRVVNEAAYQKLTVTETPHGQQLFNINCGSCHALTKLKVGPMMKGVAAIHSDEWMKKMIVNGEALRQSGDKYAVAQYNEFYGMEHPSFESLTSSDVQSIVDFLKTIK